MTYIAKDQERLEEIYYRHHGVDDGRYHAFCEKNVTLLHKDLLDAGDVVYLLEAKAEEVSSTDERIALWN